MALPEALLPPQAKGHLSVARLADYWYVACLSSSLKRRPLACRVLGVPLVVFRAPDGSAHCLLDRCPHRNVPLSLGRVLSDGSLECKYHGWQFCGDGRCQTVPGLDDLAPSKGRNVPSYAVREQDGLVWVYGTPDSTPKREPFKVHSVTPQHTRVLREVEADATLHATIENALDVPHTAFLHRGLFRGGKPNLIRAVITRHADRVAAQYHGEPRPPGLVGKLLSPSGGIVEHWDRFYLPSIAEVEYRIGPENHFIVSAMCTPVSDTKTKVFAVVHFKTRIPGRLLKLFLEPVALRIFGQDQVLLRHQTDNIFRFGGEQYVSTPMDMLGGAMWRLMKQAEQGQLSEHTDSVVHEVNFYA